MKKIIALILTLVLVGSLLAACGESNNATEAQATEAEKATEAAEATEAVDPDSDYGYVLNKGTLVVGITDFAPMDFQDTDGEWIGFDADLAKEFGKYLGVDVVFTEIQWKSKVLELDSKTIDCVWNGMTLTDDVKAAMSTSKPYCNNAQVVVVKSDAADQYQTAEACKDLKFAVENGSAGKEQAEAYGFNFIEVKDQATALMEVSAGTSGAAIIDSLMAASMVGKGTDYEDLAYTVALNSEEYGVGFRKDSNITEVFNKFLDEAVADGTVDELAELYGVSAALIK